MSGASLSPGRSAPPLPAGFEERTVTVMGLGLFDGGAGSARHFVRQGARVTVTDLRPAEELADSLRSLESVQLRYVLGEHRKQDFVDCDLVVANPAVPPESPYLELARAAGVPITSDIELFLRACPARVVAVTGTQGKSSTCHILAQLLAGAGLGNRLVGNIGCSPLDVLDELVGDEVVVLELSSYQLAALASDARSLEPSPIVAAAVTNVLADHLERHTDAAGYARAKRGMVKLVHPEGTLIFSGDDPIACGWPVAPRRRLISGTDALALRQGHFVVAGEELGRAEELPLAGAFQRQNALFALALAQLVGVPPRALRETLPRLRSLPHRLEDLGVLGGRRVWDNAVSTTPDSTASALESMQVPCTLLCGGRLKGLPLEPLLRAARGRVRRVVTFGEAAPQLAQAFGGAGFEVHAARSLETALEAVFADDPDDQPSAGEPLLFSPACSSFDAYPNFQARAHAFRAALRSL